MGAARLAELAQGGFTKGEQVIGVAERLEGLAHHVAGGVAKVTLPGGVPAQHLLGVIEDHHRVGGGVEEDVALVLDGLLFAGVEQDAVDVAGLIGGVPLDDAEVVQGE